jgi:hypothetical protein
MIFNSNEGIKKEEGKIKRDDFIFKRAFFFIIIFF